VDLEDQRRLLEKQVISLLSPLDEKAVDSLCKEAAAKTITRVTVILPDGRVVGDSEEMPANMDNHRDREEVRDAYRAKPA
jgi:two-component system phosphate regulon sensor histidine kinase PhoR